MDPNQTVFVLTMVILSVFRYGSRIYAEDFELVSIAGEKLKAHILEK